VQNDLISTTEVAEILGVSVATVNRWAAEGQLKPRHEMPGRTGARLFSRRDVARFEAKRSKPAAS
jgi:excisionase family DNA binding protein